MSITKNNPRMLDGIGTSANNLVQLDANAKLPAVDGSQLTNVNAGKVLQMPFTQYTGTTNVSLTANTNTIVNVLTVNITPASTSSIIRLDSHVFHEWSNSDYAAENVWFFYRDSTLLRAPTEGNRACGVSISSLSYRDDATSTPETVYYSYFDAPNTTSQITYKVGVRVYANSTLYVNRTVNDTNNTQGERGISFISATEIGA